MQLFQRIFLPAIVIGATAAIALVSARAQTQVDRCNNKNKIFSTDIAITACTAVIKSGRYRGKNLAHAYNNRGIAYEDKKDHNHAIADYSEAIRLDPNHVYAHYNRGGVYEDKKDYERAIADRAKAVQIDSGNAQYWNGLCWDRALEGSNLPQAIKDCDRSLQLRANDANILDSRGFAYLKWGVLDKAIADYDAALKIDPKMADSLYGRGIAKLKKGDTAGGEADIAAARAIRASIAEEYAGYGLTP
jgi:tetratricopeptide (TPR) repeat protein